MIASCGFQTTSLNGIGISHHIPLKRATKTCCQLKMAIPSGTFILKCLQMLGEIMLNRIESRLFDWWSPVKSPFRLVKSFCLSKKNHPSIHPSSHPSNVPGIWGAGRSAHPRNALRAAWFTEKSMQFEFPSQLCARPRMRLGGARWGGCGWGFNHHCLSYSWPSVDGY